jgi:membrane-bound inhibitor of C-type lysozyme
MLILPARCLLPAVLLIAGCTKPWSSTYDYTCPDGYKFNITYAGTDNPGDIAVLEDIDGKTKLPRAPSASGTRYTNEATEYFSKGDDAMILLAGEIEHRECTTD